MSDTLQDVEEFTDAEMEVITLFLLENQFLIDRGDSYSLHDSFIVFSQQYLHNPLNVLDLSRRFEGVISVLKLDMELDGNYGFWFCMMVSYLQSKGKFLTFEKCETELLFDSAEVFTAFMEGLGEEG